MFLPKYDQLSKTVYSNLQNFTQTRVTQIRLWVCVCTIVISGHQALLVTMKGWDDGKPSEMKSFTRQGYSGNRWCRNGMMLLEVCTSYNFIFQKLILTIISSILCRMERTETRCTTPFCCGSVVRIQHCIQQTQQNSGTSQNKKSFLTR